MKKGLSFILYFFYCLSCFSAPGLLDIDDQLKIPFWPAKDDLAGGVLLIQGEGSHGQDMFDTIAEILSTRGWSVALVPEAIDKEKLETQLSLMLAKLRQKSKRKIGLVWYGNQYLPLLNYFSSPQAKKVSGLILLSAYQLPPEPPEKPIKLRFPVLDIVAQFDTTVVQDEVKSRTTILETDLYLQRVIPGAYHDYRYQESLLSATIDNWLTKLPKPKVGRVFN